MSAALIPSFAKYDASEAAAAAAELLDDELLDDELLDDELLELLDVEFEELSLVFDRSDTSLIDGKVDTSTQLASINLPV